MIMEHIVRFQYYKHQEVYFLYKNYPKRGHIDEINISIKDMYKDEDDGEWCIEPNITYRIKDNWYKENELWSDKKKFKEWIDNNLCYTKYIEHKENYCYWNNQKVFLIDIIERTNNRHPWRKKKIAVIFYIDENNKGYFRYVLWKDIKDPIYEQNYIGNTKYGLMKTYGHNYIEDGIYNFVNYDGIKF